MSPSPDRQRRFQSILHRVAGFAVGAAIAFGLHTAAAALPIADAGRDIAIPVGTRVDIDASNSRAPPGRLIAFRWSILQAPAGSTAALDSRSPAPSFVADRPGDYVVKLVVVADDGTRSEPARVVLTAVEGDVVPLANAGRSQYTFPGVAVEVDGRQSHDPSSRPLAFRWSLDSRPEGSRIADADIAFADTAVARMTPDVEGRYRLELRVDNGAAASSDRVDVVATRGNLPPIADAGADAIVAHGDPVVLDGSVSVDPDARPAPLRVA